MFSAVSIFSIIVILFRTNGCFSTESGFVFQAHEKDCSKYYGEFQGIRYQFQCPTPNLFNDLLKSCDHPENVGCVSIPGDGIRVNSTQIYYKRLSSNKTENVKQSNKTAEVSHVTLSNSASPSNSPTKNETNQHTLQPILASVKPYENKDGPYISSNFSMSDSSEYINSSENMNSLVSGLSHNMGSLNFSNSQDNSTSSNESIMMSNDSYSGYMPSSQENSNENISSGESESEHFPENLNSMENDLSHGISSLNFPKEQANVMQNGIEFHELSHSPPQLLHEIHSTSKESDAESNDPNSIESVESKLSDSLSSFHFPNALDQSQSSEQMHFDENSGTAWFSPCGSSESDETPNSASSSEENSELSQNLNSLEHSLSHSLGTLNIPSDFSRPDHSGTISSSEFSQNSIQCPTSSEEDSMEDSNMVYPGNCNKFYKCFNGVPQVYDCPSPLQFNPMVGICDEPENVGCSSQNLYHNGHYFITNSHHLTQNTMHYVSHSNEDENYHNWNQPVHGHHHGGPQHTGNYQIQTMPQQSFHNQNTNEDYLDSEITESNEDKNSYSSGDYGDGFTNEDNNPNRDNQTSFEYGDNSYSSESETSESSSSNQDNKSSDIFSSKQKSNEKRVRKFQNKRNMSGKFSVKQALLQSEERSNSDSHNSSGGASNSAANNSDTDSNSASDNSKSETDSDSHNPLPLNSDIGDDLQSSNTRKKILFPVL